MNIVMIVPTGLGCEIGGHAGDANPAAKLLASCCDNLIVHPNVVNASDINEMTENMLYVDGFMLDEFLEGKIKLEKVHQNKILLVVNKPAPPETINAASAARATIGADIVIVEMNTPLRMVGRIENGIATGDYYGVKELANQLTPYDYDVLAISSAIHIERETKMNYYRNGGVNPWGGIEAITSRAISKLIGRPVAHAPYEDIKVTEDPELVCFNEVVDPRIAPEVVSVAFMHCILKGLHKAPCISDRGLSNKDIDFMVSPYGCIGRPHEACYTVDIPIIVVKENKCCLDITSGQRNFIYAENYLEAAGIIMAKKAGILPESVRRPLTPTKII